MLAQAAPSFGGVEMSQKGRFEEDSMTIVLSGSQIQYHRRRVVLEFSRKQLADFNDVFSKHHSPVHAK